MKPFVIAVGISTLLLAAGSPFIPRIFNWREDTAKLQPLTRHIFWTYAVYIWAAHILFGLVSALAPSWLLDGTPLARCVCGFMGLWWGARLVLQFTGISKHRPPGWMPRLGEAALVLHFAGCAFVYGTIAVTGGWS